MSSWDCARRSFSPTASRVAMSLGASRATRLTAQPARLGFRSLPISAYAAASPAAFASAASRLRSARNSSGSTAYRRPIAETTAGLTESATPRP